MRALSWILCSFLTMALTCSAQEVPKKYKGFFVHYTDSRSYPEKVLNSVHLTTKDVGRSFALIVGVASYRKLPPEQQLGAAAEDVRKLQNYLVTQEFFDEVVVLKDSDVTFENLRYFLVTYFPSRLRSAPKSRFLFAYSGHGFQVDSDGFLVSSEAESLTDTGNSLPMAVVRDLLAILVKSAYQTLVLVNACHSGAFLTFSGGDTALPKEPGAHVITAAGTSEKAWSDPSVGTGSEFFERLLDGLNGGADIYPVRGNQHGDGIVTVYELMDYLRANVRSSTPQLGYLARDKTEGGFFFLTDTNRC